MSFVDLICSIAIKLQKWIHIDTTQYKTITVQPAQLYRTYPLLYFKQQIQMTSNHRT